MVYKHVILTRHLTVLLFASSVSRVTVPNQPNLDPQATPRLSSALRADGISLPREVLVLLVTECTSVTLRW